MLDVIISKDFPQSRHPKGEDQKKLTLVGTLGFQKLLQGKDKWNSHDFK